MSAVFALVFVPALGSGLLMIGMLRGGLSFATAIGGFTFIALATGLLVGLFRLAKRWEDEEPTGQ